MKGPPMHGDDGDELVRSILDKQALLRTLESRNGHGARCNTEGAEDTENTESAEDTCNTEDTDTYLPGESVFSAPTAPSVLQDEVEAAIAATLPLTKGEIHRNVFRLARHLKGIPALRNADARALRAIVEAWHRRGLLGSPFLEVWADFVQAWRKVKVPIGQGIIHTAFKRAKKTDPPPMATELYGEGPIVLLAALCRELQQIVGDVEIAQKQGNTERFGQSADLVVEQAADFLPRHLGERVGCGRRLGRQWHRGVSLGCGLATNAHGGPIHPGRQGIRLADRAAAPGQDEEGCLESVLGVVEVTEHPPADAEHHRPVAVNQFGERGRVVGRRVPLEESRVGLALRGQAIGQRRQRTEQHIRHGILVDAWVAGDPLCIT
jgi:hypothetical protein